MIFLFYRDFTTLYIFISINNYNSEYITFFYLRASSLITSSIIIFSKSRVGIPDLILSRWIAFAMLINCITISKNTVLFSNLLDFIQVIIESRRLFTECTLCGPVLVLYTISRPVLVLERIAVPLNLPVGEKLDWCSHCRETVIRASLKAQGRP